MEASAEFPIRPGAAYEPDPNAGLWLAFQQGRSTQARERLFTAYFPFARKIAARHFRDRASGDIEFGDLVQLAAAGLLEAIDRFDPCLGVPFQGYAARRISGSVLDGLGKMSELREQLSFRNRLRRERTRSLYSGDELSMSGIEAMQALADLAISLALGFILEGTGAFVAGHERDTQANAYDTVAWRESVRNLMAEVTALPERERLIIQHHYLNGLTFDQIGASIGVTKGRVSQLHRAALALLNKRLRRAGEFKLER